MASRSIVLHPASGSGPRSLAIFAGRYLGETEFDIMQTYVAERVRPLLETRAPGIVFGLTVGLDGTGEAARLALRPGLGIGGDGRAIQLRFPMALDWTALRDVHKRRTRPPEAPDTPLEGWFYLTVRREVALRADSGDARPCDRDQLDILRDSRIETLASLGLQAAGAGSDLLDPPAVLGANRVAARALDSFAFDAESGAIPVALVKVMADLIAEEDGAPVILAEPGRFLSLPLASPHQTAARRSAAAALAAFWERYRTSLPTDPLAFDPSVSLSEALGQDVLPPAGRLPEGLVARIAGRPQGSGWLGPELRFDPESLQADITAVPGSQVDEMIGREATRGPIDLTEGSTDRIRIAVAVRDRDWRPDLMDLPESDSLLEDAVFRRQITARNAWRDWARGWNGLYGGLDEDALDESGEPTAATQTVFRAIGSPVPPGGAWPELDEAVRATLRIPAPVSEPLTGAAVFQRLIDSRRAEIDERGATLPRPYALGVPAAPEDLPEETEAPDFAESGLYARFFELEAQIAFLEAELDANQRLISDLDVFIRSQRQQVDSITTSFAALAGGVPGDGAGLQLARWMPYTQLNELVTTGEDG